MTQFSPPERDLILELMTRSTAALESIAESLETIAENTKQPQVVYNQAFTSAPGSSRLPHSRACGPIPHPHGYACHSNCPSCGGKED